MAIQIPQFLQTKTYSAKRLRRANQAEVMQEGIVDFGHFKVTQRGAGANMSVDVAAGEAWVDGDTSAEQGFYHVVNDAVTNVAISAASAANPRIDTLVLAVNDSTEIGGADEYKLEVIAGTPTAAASLANLSGVAAVGATKLVLAYILVGKEVTSITTEKIGGKRDYREGLTGYPVVAEPKAVAGAPAQYAHGRPLSYIPTARAYRTAVQSVANAINTAIQFNLELFDNEEIHSIASETTKFICRTPGLYLLTNEQLYSATLSPVIFFKKNGGVTDAGIELLGKQSLGSNSNSGFASILLRLGYGDYMESYVLQTSGGAVNVTGATSMAWQGP